MTTRKKLSKRHNFRRKGKSIRRGSTKRNTVRKGGMFSIFNTNPIKTPEDLFKIIDLNTLNDVGMRKNAMKFLHGEERNQPSQSLIEYMSKLNDEDFKTCIEKLKRKDLLDIFNEDQNPKPQTLKDILKEMSMTRKLGDPFE